VRLRRVEPSDPGYTRRRRGRGFSYHDEDGAVITDPATVARIRALAVPPAWRDVWICALPGGHIQAVGTDAAGRRQYRYHDEWRRRRDAAKHDRVLRLGRRLPVVRAQIREQLDDRGLSCDRVLAAALRMLDIGAFRIGGDEYAPGPEADEGSFGLATVRREHVRLRRDSIELRYPAKGGIDQVITLQDPALHAVVRALLRRRGGGEDLLAYRTKQGWHDVCAADVNARLKELAGAEFSAKDLRTWNATLLAAVVLAEGAARVCPAPSAAARGRSTPHWTRWPNTWVTPGQSRERPTWIRACSNTTSRAGRSWPRCAALEPSTSSTSMSAPALNEPYCACSEPSNCSPSHVLASSPRMIRVAGGS
jgi:DNA topoisomerase-1